MALLDTYRVRVEQIDPITWAAWVYCPGSSIPDIFFTDTVRAALITQVQNFITARRLIPDAAQWFEFPA